MTEAEKMAEDFMMGYNIWSMSEEKVKKLITTVAERGRKEAAGTISCPCHGCSGRKELILEDKWEEEEV